MICDGVFFRYWWCTGILIDWVQWKIRGSFLKESLMKLDKLMFKFYVCCCFKQGFPSWGSMAGCFLLRSGWIWYGLREDFVANRVCKVGGLHVWGVGKEGFRGRWVVDCFGWEIGSMLIWGRMMCFEKLHLKLEFILIFPVLAMRVNTKLDNNKKLARCSRRYFNL